MGISRDNKGESKLPRRSLGMGGASRDRHDVLPGMKAREGEEDEVGVKV